MWPNWTPPDDIEIDGDRNLAPIPPNASTGPDTDLQIIVQGHQPGDDPIMLLPPYRLTGDNADIPSKSMMGVGPQSGNQGNEFRNLGTMILPGWQRYLEMGGQHQVGLLPRTVPVQYNALWDANYVLNPGVEVV